MRDLNTAIAGIDAAIESRPGQPGRGLWQLKASEPRQHDRPALSTPKRSSALS